MLFLKPHLTENGQETQSSDSGGYWGLRFAEKEEHKTYGKQPDAQDDAAVLFRRQVLVRGREVV